MADYTDLQYTPTGLTIDVASMTEKTVKDLDGNDLIKFLYKSFSVAIDGDGDYSFPDGHVLKSQLDAYGGTEAENIQSFFEDLGKSYDARYRGELAETNTYLGNMGLDQMKTL